MITKEETIALFRRNDWDGWINLVEIIFDGKPDGIVIREVWDKYAELRVYYDGDDKVFSNLVNTVGFISRKMCQKCGKSGRHVQIDGWEKILCDEHFDATEAKNKFANEWFHPENKAITSQRLAQVALLVADYDEALIFYTEKLGFYLEEDTQLTETKRWIVVAPLMSHLATRIVFVKAKTESELTAIGNQVGGKVGFFLYTDNIDRYFNHLRENGVKIIQEPLEQPWGKVAIFADLYGNLWDLIEKKHGW